MITQPEALRLADKLNGAIYADHLDAMAADELRRQHTEIERLTAERDALARCKLADQDAYVAMRDQRDELQARLAALEGAYIPTYLERLAASPATLEAEFTALRSEALDLRAALAERDANLTALEKQEPVAWMNNKRDMTYFGHYNKDDLPLYAAAGAVRSIPKGIRRKLLDELGAELDCADGDEWDDAVVTMVENYLAAGAAPVPQGRKITATRIANHLKKSPLGDISMYREGFFDGAKWAAAPKEAMK